MIDHIKSGLNKVPEWAFPALVAAGFCALASYVVLIIFDDRQPTTVIWSKLLTPEVEAGGILETRRKVYRELLCNTTIYRYMKDSEGHRFDRELDGLGSTNYPNGTGPLGEEVFVGREHVPESMSPGPAQYWARPCHRCNWWDWIYPQCEPERRQEFTVIPASNAPKKAAEEIEQFLRQNDVIQQQMESPQ